MTSLFKISEQIWAVLKKGDTQTYISDVVDAYSSLARKSWYENKAEGVSDVDGSFVYTFTPVTPELDTVSDNYYIDIPSSSLILPHEMGVVFVGFPKGSGFVRVTSGSSSMFSNLKAAVMGGHQTYFVEGARFYFPKMTKSTNGPIACKLAIAYDSVNPDEELNIPRAIINGIIDIVVKKYAPSPPLVTEQIK